MRRLIIVLLGVVLSFNTFAMTFVQAQGVYKNIVTKNGFYMYPTLKLAVDDEVNAHTTPWAITINTGMLDFVQNEDELALIIGHELGHFKSGDMSSTPKAEYRADALGAKYEDRAGYNHCVGIDVLKRFNAPTSETHPSSSDRYNRLAC